MRDSAVRTAVLSFMVRNSSPYTGPLTLEYVPVGGAPIRLSQTAAYPADGIAFFVSGATPPAVVAFNVAPVTITVGTALQTTFTAADGLLVARVDGAARVQPATLRLKVDAVGPVQWSDVVIQPPKVSMHATRFLPFGTWLVPWSDARAVVHLQSADPRADAAQWRARMPQTPGGDVALARLGGDLGGNLIVALRDVHIEGAGMVGTLQAREITGSGKYEGAFALDPTAKAPRTIAVTVNVQDWFVWPLLLVLVGALVARLGMVWQDEWRPRELLRQKLKDLARRYGEAAPTAQCPYMLDALLPRGEGATGWACPRDAYPTRAERLYCALDTADTQEKLDRTRAEVAEVSDMFGLWQRTCQAAAALRVAVNDIDRLGVVPPTVPGPAPDPVPALMRESNRILNGVDAPADRKDAEAAVLLVQDQTEAAVLWKHGWELYGAAADLYAALAGLPEAHMHPRDRAALRERDPEAICAVYLWSAKTLSDLRDGGALDRLRAANRVLLSLARRYPAAAPPPGLTAFARGVLVIDSVDLGALTRARPDQRTAAELLASVRQHDLLNFGVTFIVTALAFLVTIYPGKNFGSSWQYLGAFLAGATGQVAIAWKLLPWYRSYSASSAVTAKT